MRTTIAKLAGVAAVALVLTLGGWSARSAAAATPAPSGQVVFAAERDRCQHQDYCGRPALRIALVQETLHQTGLTREQLRAEMAAGKTLAQVAGEHGSSERAVVEPVLARLSQRLDRAVANGKLTPAQKAEIMARAAERSHEIMNHAMEAI